MRKSSYLLAGLIGTAFVGSAFAAVSAEEAKQLGTTLTVVGAEKAGNKEGTIPAYTGEGVKPPAGYDPKEPFRRPNPFPDEKPLFSITAQNYTQYADKLDGNVEMFKKYPNFRMDIYPTHRTSTYPKWVLDNTLKNATACKGIDNDLKLEGCYGGIPFPIPKTGAQVMWNHLNSFTANAWEGDSRSYIVANNGNVTLADGAKYYQQSAYYDQTSTVPSKGDTIYWAVRVDSIAPARRVGEKLVLLDPLDTITVGRRAFQYIPGQRRVKLAPDLAYDTPSPTGGGIITMDDAKVYLGALDRFSWKMLPKKEKFVMANSFKITEHGACNDEVINTKSFMNPDCVRWELRRVWVAEGTVKPEFRHVYKRRVFFWDEDSGAVGTGENYDASGKLYRLSHSIAYPMYAGEGGGTAGDHTITYDLLTGASARQGSTANKGQGLTPTPPKKMVFFSPEALAGEGVR
jgi:hypothetical protein